MSIIRLSNTKNILKNTTKISGATFDTYVQKANNLQIWNEELSSSRRYVLVRVSPDDIITKIKVVTGDTLSLLDTTGTLTRKYQARYNPGVSKRLSFNLKVQGQVLEIDITHDSVTCLVKEGKGLEIRHCNKKLSLKKGKPVCEELVHEEFPDLDVGTT